MIDWGWIVIALMAGVWIGWGWAHSTVADECTYLGEFYVGENVYRCVSIKNRNADKET